MNQETKPKWLVIARNHTRGQINLGVTVYTLDQLIDATRHLREYGYKEVKSMPINRGSIG